MRDPVTTATGMTYERVKILEWFEQHDLDPLTATRVSKEVVPNNALRSLIDAFRKSVDPEETQ